MSSSFQLLYLAFKKSISKCFVSSSLLSIIFSLYSFKYIKYLFYICVRHFQLNLKLFQVWFCWLLFMVSCFHGYYLIFDCKLMFIGSSTYRNWGGGWMLHRFFYTFVYPSLRHMGMANLIPLLCLIISFRIIWPTQIVSLFLGYKPRQGLTVR